MSNPLFVFFFFFNDTATTEIYTLSLHDALPISQCRFRRGERLRRRAAELAHRRLVFHECDLVVLVDELAVLGGDFEAVVVGRAHPLTPLPSYVQVGAFALIKTNHVVAGGVDRTC